jgi:hypothetical protein
MGSPSQAGIFPRKASSGQPGIARFTGYLVVAGLLNALIVAYLICYLPPAHAPTARSLFVRALIYVAVASLAGLAGERFYWNRSETPFETDPPLSFALFALACAAGWVWVPSVVLLSRQDSPASPALAAIGAAILAAGLRRVVPTASLLRRHASGTEFGTRELFADSVLTHRREVHGYIIALCIYATACSLITRYYLNAATPLALAAFLFAWKATLEPVDLPDERKTRSRAGRRLALVTLPAILATLFALLFDVEHRNRVSIANAAALSGVNGSSRSGGSSQKAGHTARNSAIGVSGYESIILWPVQEKKQIVAPLTPPTQPLAPGTTKPRVIRFDGPYWYFQPPNNRPGPTAFQAHDTPLAVDIESRNFLPLVMEAHQSLGSSVRLARCREIQVAIENSENHPGPIALGVLLTDLASPGKPTLYLGQQPVATSQPGQFRIKSLAASEAVRFPVPAQDKIRKFDEITVMFFPDGEHFELGPKISIEQFELFPR